MKLYYGLMALGLALYSCSSSDDDGGGYYEPPIKLDLPAEGDGRVTSIKHSGSLSSSYDWTLTYNDTHLVSAKGSLVAGEVNEYTSKLSYTRKGVTIANSDNKNMVVELNDDGYIVELTVNKDVYHFSYSDNGYLVAWRKTTHDANFADEASTASAELTYEAGNLTRIEYVWNNNAPVVLTFTPSSYLNENGLLPATLSRYLGCFGFEHLYYGGMLGRPTAHLVEKVEVDGLNDEDYAIDYTYAFEGSNTTLCIFKNAQGDAASVNYGYK